MLLGMDEELPGVAGGGPPATGEGTLDFVNNTYDFDSVSYALSACVDHTGYRTANGMEIPSSTVGGSVALLLAPMRAKFATCQWTAVFSIQVLTWGDKCYIMTIDNAGEIYWIEVVCWGEWYCDCGNATQFPMADDTTHAHTSGVHKFAVTRINSKVSVSVDGNAVVSDPTACTLPVVGSPMVNFYFGGYGGGTEAHFHLRSVNVRDPVDDTQLPILSA